MPESMFHSKTGGQTTSQSLTGQENFLVGTKLFIPPIRIHQVNRPHLMERVNLGLDKALILVSAPAGYGKTTLISSWLREIDLPSAWISLDESDNDLPHFLQYFIAALERLFPGIGADLLSMLHLQPAPIDGLMRLWINEISQHATPFLLVLDDFHTIHSQPILEIVSFLLEHIPPQMHLVLISRTDPLLPLSRIRVHNQLVEIRADQLRFTRDEIAVFLNEVMELSLSADDIATLEARTEGWIAGLQLAALSMQGSKDTHSFIEAFAGSHRYIMDYLAEEVLLLQHEHIRLFLLKTSILERMSVPLCEAVIKSDGTESLNCQAILESLDEQNLFVVRLDDKKCWYRYHHLFADVLNRHLEKQLPHLLHELHQRASHWYAQNGFIPEAIHHALAGSDQDFAIQLIEQNGCLLLIRGELSTLPNWIKAVELHTQTRPWMYIFKAWLSVLTGYPDQTEEMLQAAESLISPSQPSTEVKVMQGAIATARAYRSNMQREGSRAASFARQALDCLPDVDLVSRSLRTVATSLLGDASAMSGNLEEAYQAYLEAKRTGQAAGDFHLVIVANSNLANILIEQGLLHEAAGIYSEILQLTTLPDGQKSVLAGRVYAELSQLSYEWNRLDIALQQVHQCISLCQHWGNIDLQAIGFVMLARLEYAQGRPERALEAMRVAERLANEHHLLPRYSIWVKCTLARLWLAQGNFEKASSLIGGGITTSDEIPYLHEPEYLIVLRLLLTQGEYDSALSLAQRLLLQAQAAQRMGRVIEVLVLQALIFEAKREIDQALIILKRALSLARSQGYMRIFLDEAEPMVRLLHLAKSKQIEAEYVAKLLSAVNKVSGTTPPPTQLLIEPLTLREIEVLKLIEAGCSNQAIAAKLVISIATVKRHISNLYAKLGVKTRTQAISIGKELEIFE
ncbi:MAG TPA: LuxR C-terminal-related transcriptional regulator [Anaerolineales bacterium]|nr:LuxR C-terminal-related transcriptional regulator [Anaerolineales bacterium]